MIDGNEDIDINFGSDGNNNNNMENGNINHNNDINNVNDDDNNNKTYFDLTVGNIFCDSYIKKASMERLYVAKFKEKEKEKKYNDHKDIKGLGLECLGLYFIILSIQKYKIFQSLVISK